MPDYYVALVKEYLELKGFIVRTETKYKIEQKDKRGITRVNWGDIDILGIKVRDNGIGEFIVGEVKGESQNEKEIQEINEWKFESIHVRNKLKEIVGSTNCKKFLYCWSYEPKAKELAERLQITLVSFKEIVDYMLESTREHKGWLYLKDYPNLMLLQFMKEKFHISS